jgi:hypothetical protein
MADASAAVPDELRATIVTDHSLGTLGLHCVTRERTVPINRSEINQALAKAIAYKQCGKQAEAEKWAERLVYLLECGKILRNSQ